MSLSESGLGQQIDFTQEARDYLMGLEESGQRKKILFVADKERQTWATQIPNILLRMSDHIDIEFAEDIMQAIGYAQSGNDVSLVVTDIHFTGKPYRVYEWMKTVRELEGRPPFPFVFVSNNFSPSEAIRGVFNCNARDVIYADGKITSKNVAERIVVRGLAGK